jgi:glyoxylase-like metal-dependent hydrolase (beta-lactamase superfamily II)
MGAEGKRPMKQEQEDAGTEVTEVAPGVLRMQLPISMPGLGHVNMYALEDERGIAIVDPGLPGPASWKAITDRLTSAGLKVADVHSVIITHSHHDHFGGAGRLVEESGATDVITHSAFRAWWMQPHSHEDAADESEDEHVVHDLHPDDLPKPREASSTPWGGGTTPWGTKSNFKPPLKRRLQYRLMSSRMGRGQIQRRMAPPDPTIRVKNGDVVKLARREWFAVHTPGHTLDHLCLHDPEAGVVLSGDHVLPTITPHISGMNSGRDPLGLFFESLDKVAALDDVQLVLPAHGHPFPDLKARTDAIKEHHLERLEKLETVAADMPNRRGTVEDFSHHLFRKERWGSMAESETYAHLEHLRLAGRAERHEERGLLHYTLG